jgi:hypothetical protein
MKNEITLANTVIDEVKMFYHGLFNFVKRMYAGLLKP